MWAADVHYCPAFRLNFGLQATHSDHPRDSQKPMILVEVGGIEPHTRVVAQGLTPHCSQIVPVSDHLDD